MSILIKRTDTSNTKSSIKGYPPNSIRWNGVNQSYDVYYDVVNIKWIDPDDTIIGGDTIVKWSKTVLVRKEGTNPPKNIEDGTVLVEVNRDSYEDGSKRTKYWGKSGSTFGNHDYIGYPDPVDGINLKYNTKYCYRLFTFSEEGVCNDSGSMISIITTQEKINYDPILKNNSWDIISKVSEAEVASSIWNIGDEIDITLSGDYNETITLQIWDFNHFNKSDGSGKAGIVFGMKNLMKNTQQMNTSNTNSGGWNDTYMKSTVMANILSSMPSDLQNVIKEVNTYANQGGNSSSSSKGLLSNDKVFLPGFVELFGYYYDSSQSNTESNQKQFPIFTDDSSRIKKLSNGSESVNYWWTRSPYYSYTNNFRYVSGTGSGTATYFSASYSNAVCFCFNI